MATTTDCTTLTTARLADADWSRFCREAEALAAEIAAQHPHLSPREAGDIAAEHVEARYAAELERQAETVAAPAPKRARDPRSAEERAADKARVQLAEGARVVFDGAAALVSSASRAGVVHRVEAGSCTCEAGQAGRACWHVAAVALTPRPAPAGAAINVRRIAARIAELRAARAHMLAA